MILNFKEAFTFMFKQEKFVNKYLWGTLFIFFSILPFYAFYDEVIAGIPLKTLLTIALCIFVLLFPVGYSILYANSKINSNEETLPEWTGNLGNIVENSLKYYVGFTIFTIPTSIVISIFAIIAFLIAMIISILLVGSDAISTNPQMVFAAAGLTVLFTVIFMLPFVILWHLLFMLAHSSFLADTKILSFLNFKKMFGLVRKNFLNLFLLFLILTVFSICSNLLFYMLPIAFFAISTIFGFYFMLVF